jgi:hypothetical protein
MPTPIPKRLGIQHWQGGAGHEGRDPRTSEDLDLQAEEVVLEDEGWALRYHLESQLVHLAKMEEEYWRQRGRLNWLLKGDANTAYFHAVANGRKLSSPSVRPGVHL